MSANGGGQPKQLDHVGLLEGCALLAPHVLSHQRAKGREGNCDTRPFTLEADLDVTVKPAVVKEDRVAMLECVHSPILARTLTKVDDQRPRGDYNGGMSQQRKCIACDSTVRSSIPLNPHIDGFGVVRYDLQYPRVDGNPKVIEIGLECVRASDSIRITFDFDRNGWSILQASTFSWEANDEVRDSDWQEVAFVESYGRERPDQPHLEGME